jgi:hypothetical protein
MTRTFAHPFLLAQQQHRQRLLSLGKQLLANFEQCYPPMLRIPLQQQVQALQTQKQLVLVMGATHAGKTTTINAILGQKVLPACFGPMPPLLAEVSWGPYPIARLHSSPSACGTPEPREMALTDLEGYLMSATNEQLEQYERVEVFLPHPLLQCGITFVEIPSLFVLTDSAAESEMTERIQGYLASATVVLYLLGSYTLLNLEEELMINTIRQATYAEVFFLCNRTDCITASLHAHKPHEHLVYLSRLMNSQPGTYRRIFFTNAKAALCARLEEVEEPHVQSGFAQVETSLFDLLARQMREELKSAERDLRYILAHMLYVVEHQQPLYKQASGGINTKMLRRYLDAYSQVQELEHLRLRSSLPLLNLRNALRREITELAACFSFDAIEAVDSWVQEYDSSPRQDRGLWAFLAQRFQQKFILWLKQVLHPLLYAKLRAMMTALQTEHEPFFTLLAHLHTMLEGGKIASAQSSEEAFPEQQWRTIMWKQLHELPEDIIGAVEITCGYCGNVNEVEVGTSPLSLFMASAHAAQAPSEKPGQQFQEALLAIQQQWAQRISAHVDRPLAWLQAALDEQLYMFIDVINTLMLEDLHIRQTNDPIAQARTSSKIEHTLSLLQTMYNEVTVYS